MQFDLRQLSRNSGEDHLERTFDASYFQTPETRDEDYAVVAPVHLVMDVRKDGAAYRVTGHVRTRLQLECGRCLEGFETPVDSAFELRYVPESARAESEEAEVAEDDLTTAYYRDETLDLGELMHEQFVLALPMKPLCSEACQGLCPTCGTNLSKGACGCPPEWKDPRLGALQGILDRQKES
ncbi:MAG TPA: DUF177 domain-containing protein [Vicinamibacterales bacterium]|jgi:uncharacterized protein